MSEKSIYLTFDDGPNEPYTSEILQILKKFNAEATFFVCGRNVERDPGALKKIFAAGHSIGNHAYSHSWRKSISASLYDEFKKTDDIIFQTIGIRTKLLRPPWGRIRNVVRKHLEHDGYQLVFWNAHAFDWWQPPVAFIAKYIIRQAFDGCIVLLHDGEKAIPGTSRTRTVQALRTIIPKLQERGYVFRKL